VFSEIDVYLPSFSSHSYLEFGGRITSSLSTFTDIEIVFRTSFPDGLLLYSGLLLTKNSWPWRVTLNVDQRVTTLLLLTLTWWHWPRLVTSQTWIVVDWRSAAVQRLHGRTGSRLYIHLTDARIRRV